jgi:MraZ protein
VEVEDFFQGSALNAVDAKGRLSVPAFVRGVIERRSDSRAVVVGAHEISPCLTAYGRNYARNLWTDLERRRLAEEDRAAPSRIITPAPAAPSA